MAPGKRSLEVGQARILTIDPRGRRLSALAPSVVPPAELTGCAAAWVWTGFIAASVSIETSDWAWTWADGPWSR